MKRLCLIALPLATCAQLLTGSIAWSEPATGAQEASLTNAGASQLEEIVVTAQKRAENLQDVPISISAISASTLAATGIQHVQELPLLLPGLQIPNTGGFALPRVRGVGSTVAAAGNENPVAVYIDGVYIAAPAGGVLSLNNLDQVALLKGPQGTLFGRNATGGVLQLVTRDPSDTFSGHADIGYGNYETTTGDLYVTGPIGKIVDADLAVQAATQGKGYGINQFNGSEIYKTDLDLSLRSKWLIRPSDTTRIALGFDFQQTNGPLNIASETYPGTQSALGPVALSHQWNTDNDYPTYMSTRSGGTSVAIDQDLGSVRLTSISAYRQLQTRFHTDFDVTPTPGLGISWDVDNQEITQEIRLQSNHPSKLNWTVGGYYYYARDAYNPENIYFFGPIADLEGVTNEQTFDRQYTTAYAAFAQATYELPENTHLTAGTRYSHETKGLEGNQSIAPTGEDFRVPLPPVTGDLAFDKVTWRAALDHRFTDNVLAYVSYNTGFKSGGFNLSSPADKAYEPETLTAYEAGIKTDWLDRRLRLNGAGFYYDYNNIQVNAFTQTGGFQIVYNGAKSKLYGVDFDYEALLTDNLMLSGGVEGLRTEFTSFPNAVIGTPVAGGGVSLVPGNAKGNKLPFAPPFQSSTTLSYKIPRPQGSFDLSATYGYTDKYFGNADNIMYQPAYNSVSASVLWTDPSKRYSVRLWGLNLTNAVVYTVMAQSALVDAVSLAPPRTFGVQLGVKW